jgi:acetyl esterase/lipase
VRILPGISVFLAWLLSACSPMAAVNLLVPKSGYSVRRDIAYGSDPRQKLDVYIPDGLKGPAPVLLFFYGGSWQSGSRRDYPGFGQAFASKGIVTMVADYRLYPQVKFPAFVEDGARAVAFAHAHAKEFGGDPKRLFVSGHSAGGYIAAMLGSDARYVKDAGGDFSWMRGIIGVAGPYDFLPLTDPAYIDMFHGADNRAILPITYIDDAKGRPPMLLVAGAADSTVGPGNVTRMAKALTAHGDAVETKFYPGVGHIGIIVSLLPPFRGYTPLRDDMVTFIQSH